MLISLEEIESLTEEKYLTLWILEERRENFCQKLRIKDVEWLANSIQLHTFSENIPGMKSKVIWVLGDKLAESYRNHSGGSWHFHYFSFLASLIILDWDQYFLYWNYPTNLILFPFNFIKIWSFPVCGPSQAPIIMKKAQNRQNLKRNRQTERTTIINNSEKQN